MVEVTSLGAPHHDQGGDPACWSGLVTDQRDRRDIASRTDVNDIVLAFYREIMLDDLLAPVFDEDAEVHWPHHIHVLIDYWCWILLRTPGYQGNVTRAHRHLQTLRPIEPEHCERWITLWRAAVSGRFAGPVADHALSHATTLMTGMAKHVFTCSWPDGHR